MAEPRSSFSSHGQGGDGRDDEINLLEYWQILVERRNVVLGCLLATVVAVMLLTLLSTPRYQATTTLQIERQGPDVLTFKDVIGVDPMGYKDYYQTQYKILQSRAVLKLAAGKLDLPNHPEFAGRKASPISRMAKWVRTTISGSGGPPDPMERAVLFLEDGLSIQPVRNSHLVQVSFLDRDGEFAAEIANAVAGAYQEFNIVNRYTTTEQASEFLTKEVARIEVQISALQRKLQDYTTDKELIALSDGAEDIHEQALRDLNERLSTAKGRLAVAEARYRSVQEAAPETLQEVLNSQLIHRLRQDHAEVERRHAQMTERFRPGWPALAEVEEELRRARGRLFEEIETIALQVREGTRTDYAQAKDEVVNLQAEVDREKGEVQRVQRDAIEYGSLKAEIASRREVLNDLVARQSQTETSGQMRDPGASNSRVVDRAEPPEHAATPKKALNLVLATMIGMTLGVGMAFLLHYLDNTIKGEQDLVRYAPHTPILGHIPMFQRLRVVEGGKDGEPETADSLNPELASHEDSRSIFAEAFKNLRTSLLLSSADHPPARMVVTSCEPADGKSTVASNLAIVLTQMGKRVLLVDADLRRPCVHKRLNLPNDVGLSSYLTGHAKIHDLYQETAVPNLSVITSGPIPPNPSELLDSPGLTSLMTEAEKAGYDHVIFDSPPVLQVADSIVLGTRADTTLLVVRSGVTSRDALSQGVARLEQSRVAVAGAVLNAVTERAGYYNRYRYYRKYGYGREGDSRDAAAESGAASAIKRTARRLRRRAGGG